MDPLAAPISYEQAKITSRSALASEIDELGHVNNAEYVRWIQDAATAHWFVVAPDEMIRDYVWVCLRHEIDYREPVLEAETVEIRTWLGACRGPRFDRYVDIRKPGAKKGSVRCKTTWVLLDAHTRRPVKVSDTILSVFGLDRAMIDTP